MKKIILLVTSVVLSVSMFAGCSSTSGAATGSKIKYYDKITMIWYPNESADAFKETRDELCKVIETATGKKVDQKTTTDYSIAVEAIASGNGQIAFMGGQGYVEANKKNSKVLPLVVNTGESGTLDDAIYYSWLAVNKGTESEYEKDGKYEIDNIQGKKISFVSNSSTSGFKVPTAGIIKQFSTQDKWKTLEADNLIEGGSDKFFSEVLFGQSHQGAAANLLTGKAEVAAFCDTVLAPYVEVTTGNANAVGAVYKIKEGASDPFTNLVGKEYVLINSTPVLNGPFAVNTNTLKQEDIDKIRDAFIADSTTNNKKIFYIKGETEGLIEKKKDTKFVAVEDAWYDPIRKLSE
ncbi:PhnD/SsuA/transferrin family substrate-binding protein [Clostridium sp.]|uniref:PhnD/SsuA/transferrin family substrate-binding protein n=1 Tax=Clostridium sp. TaxID=1506 RepID=UPI003D6CCB89